MYSTLRPDEAENRLSRVEGPACSKRTAAGMLSALVDAVLLAEGVFGLVTN